MSSKTFSLCLLGLGLIVLGVALPALHSARIKKVWFTRDQLGCIRPGMTQEEVESVLGFPPGDYFTSKSVLTPPFSIWDSNRFTMWRSDSGIIGVEFDEHARVVCAEFWGVLVLEPPGMLERIKATVTAFWDRGP
jgi:hypothetical protein